MKDAFMLNNLRALARRLLFVVAFALVLGAQAAPPDTSRTNDFKVTSAGGRAALNSKLQKLGRVKVIVTLNLSVPFRPAGHLPQESAQDQRMAIGQAQSQLMRELAGLQASEVKHFSEVPQVALEVSAVELETLLNSGTVQSIAEDEIKMLHLDLSVPRIGGSGMAGQGVNGAGVTMAILDTGVQKDHPFLSGAVISEACYSTSYVSYQYSTTPLCPGGVTSSTATGSAMPYASGACPTGQCDHGTHVAGITAGRYNGSFTGVAPGASIIAIQVFTRINDTAGGICGAAGSTCVLAFTSDIISALQRVMALRTTYNIASVNMSLGGGKYLSYCDTDSVKPSIDALRSYNIATVISSGNSGYTNAIASPACISSAVSVGATDDNDAVASYSNTAPFLGMLAPGSSINSSVPFTSYANYYGTSMAAPHVTGAWALLRQARPNASVSDVFTALVNKGVSITDTKIAITKPRINVYIAATALPFSGNGKIGVFRDGWWYLDVNGNGLWDSGIDKSLNFGMAGDQPITGDWNGDGKVKIGVFRNGIWYLDYNGDGGWDSGDKVYSFGQAGDIPVVGDWNHDGKAKIGVFRNGIWYLDYNGDGNWGSVDKAYSFGQAGDVPVVGDWSGNGISKIGVFRNGWWYLDYNGNGMWDDPVTDTVYSFGQSGDIPVVGDWNGKGLSRIGVFRNGDWYLDYLGSGSWKGTIADQATNFGSWGDKPVIGKSW
jgi:subtilisin family serine protease